MNAQPAPFTPAECDLRGYEWMPLFGARLFASNFEAHASDLAFRIAIKLYWECWQQVPAASLPNDDVQLCRLAGLGRDLKTWRKLRADGVLHGFVLCSDDRLYHGLIAAEAIKAWECRQKTQHEQDGWRERKRRQRASHSNGSGEHVPRDILDCPAGHHGGQEPMSRGMSPRARLRQDSTVQEKKGPTPYPFHGRGSTPAAPGAPPGRREDGSNPRALGLNPRELGTNPRATGTNPRQGFVSGGIAVLADRLLQRAMNRQGDERTDEASCLQIVEGGRG